MSDLSRKELKRPDAILENLREGYSWTSHHLKLVVGLFVLIFLVISIWTLGQQFIHHREEKGLSAYYKANEALDKKKGELATKKEKSKDLIKDLDLEIKDLEKVASGSTKSKATFLTYLTLGDLYNENKKYDVASGHYEKALNIAPNRFYKILALYNLGYSYELSGQYDKAIDTFKKMTEFKKQRVGLWTMGYRPNAFWISSAYFGIGRCYEKLQKRDEAKDSYLKVSDEFPNTQYADRGKAYAQLVQ